MKTSFLEFFPSGELRRPTAFPEDHEHEQKAPERARPAFALKAGRCPECGDDLLPAGGCRVCRQCGWEACGW